MTHRRRARRPTSCRRSCPAPSMWHPLRAAKAGDSRPRSQTLLPTPGPSPRGAVVMQHPRRAYAGSRHGDHRRRQRQNLRLDSGITADRDAGVLPLDVAARRHRRRNLPLGTGPSHRPSSPPPSPRHRRHPPRHLRLPTSTPCSPSRRHLRMVTRFASFVPLSRSLRGSSIAPWVQTSPAITKRLHARTTAQAHAQAPSNGRWNRPARDCISQSRLRRDRGNPAPAPQRRVER